MNKSFRTYNVRWFFVICHVEVQFRLNIEMTVINEKSSVITKLNAQQIYFLKLFLLTEVNLPSPTT